MLNIHFFFLKEDWEEKSLNSRMEFKKSKFLGFLSVLKNSSCLRFFLFKVLWFYAKSTELLKKPSHRQLSHSVDAGIDLFHDSDHMSVIVE